jgi:hypothetical protein
MQCTKAAQASTGLHHNWAFAGAFFDLGREMRRMPRLFLVQLCLFIDFCYN